MKRKQKPGPYSNDPRQWRVRYVRGSGDNYELVYGSGRWARVTTGSARAIDLWLSTRGIDTAKIAVVITGRPALREWATKEAT